MNILVRLPNWLGDMVMSTAFIKAVEQQYPTALIDVIVKKGLGELIPFFPAVNQVYLFDKSEYQGLSGAFRFGKMISIQKKYDLFFCLPDSFSSALMGYAAGARQRIGYKNEMRSILFTHSYQKDNSKHRASQYVHLLNQYKGNHNKVTVELQHSVATVHNRVIINCNSEAGSRRLPVEKAVTMIQQLQQQFSNFEWILIGSTKEKQHVDAIVQQLPAGSVTNMAGATGLKELTELLASASLVVSTDSGPAHVANAAGVKTIVLFGAGNEQQTAPYNKTACKTVRHGSLSCEPCIKNKCRFGDPKCLLELDMKKIETAFTQFINV
ncbi:MAG TPA: lipopolysaccharide heptosyltransferase II [Lacibacter sp.]|nr:lipopolysaccharide heptosyltransferase II [Lacibacter sp.]